MRQNTTDVTACIRSESGQLRAQTPAEVEHGKIVFPEFDAPKSSGLYDFVVEVRAMASVSSLVCNGYSAGMSLCNGRQYHSALAGQVYDKKSVVLASSKLKLIVEEGNVPTGLRLHGVTPGQPVQCGIDDSNFVLRIGVITENGQPWLTQSDSTRRAMDAAPSNAALRVSFKGEDGSTQSSQSQSSQSLGNVQDHLEPEAAPTSDGTTVFLLTNVPPRVHHR